MSAPHHHPRLEISVWLDREAAKCAAGNGDIEKAARLREAAAELRAARATIVRLRMAKAVKS